MNKANKMEMPELMEAKFTTRANTAFSEISEEVREEVGLPTKEKVFPEWQEWLNKEAKKMKKKKA